jgi:hypothetical protein
MEHLPPENLSAAELFDYMRKLAKSRDIVERLRILWIAAPFGERLERCSDAHIGDLLSKVQERMSLFTAEYSVCEQAKRRLQKFSPQINRILWRLLK